MLPHDADPAAYRWPVAGRELILLATGATDQRILATCRALLRHGALRIAIIHGVSWRTPRLSVVSTRAVNRAA